MSPKKRKLDVTEFFDDMVEFLRSQGSPVGELKRFKSAILSRATMLPTKPATEFTLEDAVDTFGLKYESDLPLTSSGSPLWRIEDIPDTQGFIPTPCLLLLMENYAKNFDRSTEVGCRVALDVILNECLTVMKGNDVNPGPDGRFQRTPTPFDEIKVFGEVSFSHRVTGQEEARSAGIIVNGRVDHGIGRVLKSHRNYTKRRFQSLLLVVEAKTIRNLPAALDQLVVYLACLRQSRLMRNRSDASVYGVASDGYAFQFVMIKHDGTVERSKTFDVQVKGDIVAVLGCIKYLLELSASMLPNLTPEKKGGQALQDDVGDDPAIDLHDNPYRHPPQDDDDDDEAP